MCATAAPALLFVLLVATLSLSIMCGNGLSADGLPLSRRERGTDDYEDILAGNEFLSVFLRSSLRRARKETTTESDKEPNFLQDALITEPYVRTSRDAGSYFENVPITTEGQISTLKTSDSSSSDGVIISVHVSKSVGSQNSAKTSVKDESLGESTTQGLDQNFLIEEHPIVAKSSDSKLNVEEPEPITMNNDDSKEDDKSSMKIDNFQASVHNLPASQHISYNPQEYINKQGSENLPPFHHSFIYHDTPKEPGRARSVSYSTIIQAIPHVDTKPEDMHERKERNYDTGIGYRNSFDSSNDKKKISSIEAKTEAVGSTTTQNSATWELPLRPTQKTSDESEGSSEQSYSSPSTSKVPMVYGKPEENYEVDEAVSVVTNGRAHGVQDGQINAKKNSGQDKDKKFGYVVEGRNYRKYRVEERTPDGFIVGEYGVVSHDDGSLRGVRYTADGTINPRLIYDALMKFLSL